MKQLLKTDTYKMFFKKYFPPKKSSISHNYFHSKIGKYNIIQFFLKTLFCFKSLKGGKIVHLTNITRIVIYPWDSSSCYFIILIYLIMSTRAIISIFDKLDGFNIFVN